MVFEPKQNVSLSEHTTLALGGPAEFFAEACTEREIVQALDWARTRGAPVHILGSGSNLVVGDGGVSGLVLKMATRGRTQRDCGPDAEITVAAGEALDAFVAAQAAAGLTGLECLSGIPGTVGAAPVQNVGAYGCETADHLVRLRVLNRATLATGSWSRDECVFRYRSSRFKDDPERFLVLEVTFRLAKTGAPVLHHAEVQCALAGATPTPALVRERVLAIRRAKSMLVDPRDENGRSAGSFFVNPVVEATVAERCVHEARASGQIRSPADFPRYPQPDGKVKLAAAWLVEHAGFAKGARRGAVGVSSRHALSLVHHGGGSTAALLDLAREIRDGVRQRFGVELTPEPSFWGVSF